MPVFLQQRDTVSEERMDSPDCDKNELFNTYKQFAVVNGLISRWKTIYNKRIKPVCSSSSHSFSLLDIGFGGGDLPIKFSAWAREDGIDLKITAIETDPRACEYVDRLQTPGNIVFRQISAAELLNEGNSFDFVISNHLLHHLQRNELYTLLDQSLQLSTRQVLFNDIERSDVGYVLFNAISRPLFRSSFITEDGLTSIKRSFTANELKNIVTGGWQVNRIFPFRLLLSYEHASQ